MRLRYAAFLSPIALLPLVLTTPVACGCEPDPTSIAGQMQIYVPYGSKATSAAASRALGEQAFLGRSIKSLARVPNPDLECTATGSGDLKCVYWSEVGVLYSSGRLVRIASDASGKVTSVSVSRIHKALGVAFGAGT